MIASRARVLWFLLAASCSAADETTLEVQERTLKGRVGAALDPISPAAEPLPTRVTLLSELQQPVPAYLTFANLQMVAEASFGFREGGADAATAPGTTRAYGDVAQLTSELVLGNGRASRFPRALAESFEGFAIREHLSNTTTGFSGTLFEYTGPIDPRLGLETGQLVMSFRSTEIIDDLARDAEATDREISQHGFAFGQLADIELWYQGLLERGVVHPTQSLIVTGYSLGGHLATAFTLLHPETVVETVTFNAPGVGRMASSTELAAILAEFQQRRSQGSADDFQSGPASSLYAILRPSLNPPANGDAVEAAISSVQQALDEAPGAGEGQRTIDELGRLRDALRPIERLFDAVERIERGIASGDASPPARVVAAAQIEALRLDYQLAVEHARRSTCSVFALQGLLGRVTAADQQRANLFELFGEIAPSAVASGQLHFGVPVPVFIENQPILRGILSELLFFSLPGGDRERAERATFGGLSLVRDNFVPNDYGDTHSLVLLVDSLSLLDVLTRLDPTLSAGTAGGLLRGVTEAVADVELFGQGTAEGDALERALDMLRVIVQGPGVAETRGNRAGGTWARIDDADGFHGRDTFHARLRALVDDPRFATLEGRVLVDLGHDPERSRDDFAALVSLITGATFGLRLADPGDELARQALAAVHPELHEAWLADREALARGADPDGLDFSDEQLADRARYLAALARYNRAVDPARDRIAPPIAAAPQQIYFDASSGRSLTEVVDPLPDLPDGPAIPAPELPEVSFNVSDDRRGTPRDDRLYATLLASLSGLGGDDVLQGGRGSNGLSGGEGDDTLAGGPGDDELDGGPGDDRLFGGRDFDRYVFALGGGHDEVVDSDGQGSIEVDGVAVTGAGALQSNASTWQTRDANVRFVLVDRGGGQQALVIGFAGRRDSIAILGWSPGQNLGITLGSEPFEVETERVFEGDFEKALELDNPATDFDESVVYQVADDGNFVPNGPEPGALDLIAGTEQGDLLRGLEGSDQLDGNSGDDRIEGGGGGDLLVGGPGADLILGGDGPDLILGSGIGAIQYPSATTSPGPEITGPVIAQGLSWVWVQTSDDRSLLSGAPTEDFPGDDGNSIDAGEGDDQVCAGTGADLVSVGPGLNEAHGLGGSDVVLGGPERDLLLGDGARSTDPNSFCVSEPEQDDDDLLSGGGGSDALIGQGGSDRLFGGAEDDELKGDATEGDTPAALHGDDLLEGGLGADTLIGAGGDDRLSGGENDDVLLGDEARNRLAPERHGRDRIDGGPGDDQLRGGGRDDVLFGGPGSDLIDGDDFAFDETSPSGNDRVEGGAGDDFLFGQAGDDVLSGGLGDDVLNGDSGADLLIGGPGEDSLQGGPDADALIGGPGSDYLNGGLGNDLYVLRTDHVPVLGESTTEFIDDVDGFDTVRFEDLFSSDVQLFELQGFIVLLFANRRAVALNGAAGENVSFAFLDGTFTLQGLREALRPNTLSSECAP